MLRWFSGSEMLQLAALVRVGPELAAAALRHPARLYIAHHAAVLPVAAKAAAKFDGRVGYDAEDFYAGIQAPAMFQRNIENIERRYLPACDYVTASSREIADAYSKKYRITPPVTVRNVFPLFQRPAAFRIGRALEPLRLYWFSQCIGSGRGLEDVVGAMALLGNCEVELHLRGRWQAGYREQLFALARSGGVRSHRIVSHEPAPPDDMVRLAAEYDVGLALEQPVDRNKTVCLSNKLFVYLLAGNAVAATNVGAQESLVAELGSAATSFAPGDIASLASHLHNWYHDRASLEESRRLAWEWGERRYNWDIEKRAFLSAVESVLPGSGAPVAVNASSI
jgi:glycosyltransferase involved in cell wall biosynthesis